MEQPVTKKYAIDTVIDIFYAISLRKDLEKINYEAETGYHLYETAFRNNGEISTRRINEYTLDSQFRRVDKVRRDDKRVWINSFAPNEKEAEKKALIAMIKSITSTY